MKWSTLQSKVYGLNINDFVNDEFLDEIINEFEDKDVDVVTLQIAVRDKVKDSKNDDLKVDLISLSNNTIEEHYCIKLLLMLHLMKILKK